MTKPPPEPAMVEAPPSLANYRVVETRNPPPFVIRRIVYNAKGEPVSHHAVEIAGFSADHLTDVLNEIAYALTKPSLLESDFKARPRLIGLN